MREGSRYPPNYATCLGKQINSFGRKKRQINGSVIISHVALPPTSPMVSCIITSNTSLPILFIIHAADAGKTWWPGHAEHSDHCLPTIPITSSNLYPLHPRYLISQHIVILIFTLENCDNKKVIDISVDRLFEGSNMHPT